MAAVQKDLKRLVAYGSVADVGFIVLGVFAFTNQGDLGRRAGDGQPRADHRRPVLPRRHAAGSAASTLRISELGGLQKSAPIMAAVFLVVVMAAIGLPGLNGFVGEFLVLVGTFITHRWWAVVGTTGVDPLGRLPAVGLPAGVPGPDQPANEGVLDMTWREKVAIAPLLARHRVPRHLPQAGARPRHPVGQPPDRSTSSTPTRRSTSRPRAAAGTVVAVPADQNVDGGPQTPHRGQTAGPSAPPAATAAAPPQEAHRDRAASRSLAAQTVGDRRPRAAPSPPAGSTDLCTATNSLHIPVEYRSILPLLVLSIGALVLLVISAVLPKRSRPGLYPLLTALISPGRRGRRCSSGSTSATHSAVAPSATRSSTTASACCSCC